MPQASPFRREDLIGATLHWLLDMEIGGETYRFAQRDLLAPMGEADATVQYRGAIIGGIEWEEAADLPGRGGIPRSRSLTLSLVAPELLVTTRSREVGAARCTLWRWKEGTYRAVRYLSGYALKLRHGRDEEPFSFTIEQDPWRDASNLVPFDATVTADTWGNSSEKIRGERYPWIIGHPGAGEPGSPGLAVDSGNRYLLIAGHRVHAAQVSIVGQHDGSSATRSVIETQDGKGRTVSVVQLPSSGAGKYDADGEWWVAWSDTTGFGGGLIDERTDLPLRGAADVAAWALARASDDADVPATIADAAVLNHYLIDAAITPSKAERVSAWDWLSSHLLDLCPAAAVLRPRGLAICPWRIGASRAECLAEFTTRDGWLEPVEGAGVRHSSWFATLSSLGVRFQRDAMRSRWAGELTLAADTADAQPGAVEHWAFRSRRHLYPAQREPAVSELYITSDRATAARHGEWVALWRAGPYRTIELDAAPEFGWLRPCDTVYLTVSDYGIAQPAHLQSIRYLDTGWHRLRFILIDNPRRDG